MCTLAKRGNLFILTLTGDDPEHRLSPTLIQSIHAALAKVKSQAVSGSVLITRSEGKFFSNGIDLQHVQAVGAKAGSAEAAKEEFVRVAYLVRGIMADLISLPMPTIAAVTGHAAAAGMLLVMCHDYIMMTSSRGVLYMSELDIGMNLPNMTTLIRAKIGSGHALRDVMLSAAKVRADAAARMGIVDSVHETADAVVAAAERKAEELGKRNWKGEVYAEIRKGLYPEVCGFLGLKDTPIPNARL